MNTIASRVLLLQYTPDTSEEERITHIKLLVRSQLYAGIDAPKGNISSFHIVDEHDSRPRSFCRISGFNSVT